MSNKSTIVTVSIVGIICIVGSYFMLLKEDDNFSKKQSFQSTQAVATATPETEYDKYTAVMNEERKGTGSKHLLNKTFYFADYSNSTVTTIEEACEYVQNSSEDYFLTYDENKATGQIVGVKFEKATEGLERKYGSTTD